MFKDEPNKRGYFPTLEYKKRRIFQLIRIYEDCNNLKMFESTHPILITAIWKAVDANKGNKLTFYINTLAKMVDDKQGDR